MQPQTRSTWRASPPAFAQADCTFCQGTGWQLVSNPAFSQARRCPCRDLTRLMRLKENIGLPQRYERCNFATFNPLNLSHIRALEEARKFSERFPGVSRGLFFTGPPGTGKTHLAAAILQDLCSRVQQDLLFADFASVLPAQDWSASDSEGRRRHLERLRRVSLLVLDGFGLAFPSDEGVHFTEQLFEVRLRRGHITILTGESVRCRELFDGHPSTRASRTQVFLSAIHPALLMRILAAVKVVAVAGEDYRRFSPPLFG